MANDNGTHSGAGRHRGTPTSSSPHTIQPSDHFGPTTLDDKNARIQDDPNNAYNKDGLKVKVRKAGVDTNNLVDTASHFRPDSELNKWYTGGASIKEVDKNAVSESKASISNDRGYTRNPLDYGIESIDGYGNMQPFAGSTTSMNPTDDPEKNAVLTYGLENAEIQRINNLDPQDQTIKLKEFNGKSNFDPESFNLPPISPLQPFTRMADPDMAQILNTFAYNRYHYPIADLEHRKAFRNLFFTRPECYIYCQEKKLSRQCELDDTIASSNSRYPHILKMLSPVYLWGSRAGNYNTFGPNQNMRDNINYLLSNRAKGFSITEETLSVNESVGKSIEGYTVVPGMHMESHQGGTFNVTFTDTKYLEIYEYFRMWMTYIYKRKKGTIEPPYNKYSYTNDFPATWKDLSAEDKSQWTHPYDRALEYAASLFDFVTNEANDRIIYWCKYYGIYPISVSINGLNSDSNQPMASEITVEVTFRYQYKVPCENRNLVEFNFNTGICDSIGHLTSGIKLDAANGFMASDQMFNIKDNSFGKDSQNRNMHHIPYIGATDMFVGTPYVVMGRFKREPTRDNKGQLTVFPFLRFMPLKDKRFNTYGNLNINSNHSFLATLSDIEPVVTSD